MTTRILGVSERLARIFASQVFWYAVFALFIVQAAWLACSAAYPMAFDEQYHFGLIQLHAHQWLPFFTSQPPTGAYGAAVRDPSYLWPVDASRLGRVSVVSGSKAWEAALQLGYDGVEIDRVVPDLSEALDAFFALPAPEHGRKTVIFTADSMRRTRAHLGLTSSEQDDA